MVDPSNRRMGPSSEEAEQLGSLGLHRHPEQGADACRQSHGQGSPKQNADSTDSYMGTARAGSHAAQDRQEKKGNAGNAGRQAWSWNDNRGQEG